MQKNIYIYGIIVAIVLASFFVEGGISSSQVQNPETVVVRYDDGEMDDYTRLGNRDVYIIKNLDLEINLNDYTTATLYIYGKVSDCSGISRGGNIILGIGNPDGGGYMQFNPCDDFSENWEWVSFDIPIDILGREMNSLYIRNNQDYDSFGDILYVGYDTDTTDYDRSKIIDIYPPKTSLTYDFENMVYLKIS